MLGLLWELKVVVVRWVSSLEVLVCEDGQVAVEHGLSMRSLGTRYMHEYAGLVSKFGCKVLRYKRGLYIIK